MRNRNALVKKILLTLLMAVGVPAGADQRLVAGEHAQELTLPAAVDIALGANPLVRAARAGQERAGAQLSEARAGRFPLLQFSETFARGNNPVFVFGSLLEQGRFGPQNFAISSLVSPAPLNNFRTAMTLRLPLFDQRQTNTHIAQAHISQEQADKQRQQLEQQIRFEVIRAYYGVLVAQAKKEVADEAVRLAEADVTRIRDRFETGLIVQSDWLAAEVQLAEFRQQRIQAEGDVVMAYASLNTALGLSINTPEKIKGALVERTFDVASPEELIRLALLYRPDYARADLAVRAGAQGVRGARGQFLPRLDVFGTFGASGPGLASGGTDYTVGASLTFNVLDLGRGARLHQARAAQSMAAAEREHLANQIRLEVLRAYQQYVSARARVAVAARAVEQAAEALRIVQDRHRAGLTTITEALRAETAFMRARMNLLVVRYEHYVGYANVRLASGTLTDVQPFGS